MQHAVVAKRLDQFGQQLNELLGSGAKIVPGTMFNGVPDFSTMGPMFVHRLPSSETQHLVVVELTLAQAEAMVATRTAAAEAAAAAATRKANEAADKKRRDKLRDMLRTQRWEAAMAKLTGLPLDCPGMPPDTLSAAARDWCLRKGLVTLEQIYRYEFIDIPRRFEVSFRRLTSWLRGLYPDVRYAGRIQNIEITDAEIEAAILADVNKNTPVIEAPIDVQAVLTDYRNRILEHLGDSGAVASVAYTISNEIELLLKQWNLATLGKPRELKCKHVGTQPFAAQLDGEGPLELEIWHDPEADSYFGVDASFLEQVGDMVYSPYNPHRHCSVIDESVETENVDGQESVSKVSAHTGAG